MTGAAASVFPRLHSHYRLLAGSRGHEMAVNYRDRARRKWHSEGRLPRHRERDAG
jgi:hypothetical protein